MSDVDPFLAEAERRGLLTAAQSAECRRLAASMAEVQSEMSIDEIAARKGFLAAPQAAEIRRALARMRVGRYEVIGKLGEGAAGVVWKARDTKLDRVVALKVLSQKAQQTPEFRERFLSEARIAVTLNHVNIARGLDYGEADGYQYFAMEFIEGENAETRLARLGRLPEKSAVAVALDVVHALSHVQKLHVVHRDIKPGNLMITLTGHAKLCDLGLAKPILAQRDLVEGDGSIAGTPFYMSPEQIQDPENIDWRSDVYSLGATLYHLLTGVPPFRPDVQGGVIQKHLKEKPKSPREHVLELSDGVSSVVLRMLQKSPDDRYESLDDLTADLESVLAGRTPLHLSPPPPPSDATAERHARHAVARRITEQTLPREPFPWQALALFALFVGGLIAISVTRNAARKESPPDVATTGDRSPPPVLRRDPATTTPAPTPAKPPVAAADTELNRRADEELRERSKRATEQATAGRYSAARSLLLEFPAEFQSTDAAKRAVAEAGKFEIIARDRFDDLVKQGNAAAAKHHFDEARALIEKASLVDTNWAEEEAGKAKSLIEVMARDYERRREEQADGFADFYGQVLLTAGKRGFAAARSVVDEKSGALDAYDFDASELRRDVDLLESSHVDPHTTLPGDAKVALAVVLAHLSLGELVQAERAVEAVGRFGGDEVAARRRVAMVRVALVTQASELLAKAEAALSAGKAGDANRLAEDARALLPDFVPTRVMLGRIRFAQGAVADARTLLSAAARSRDAPPDAHLWFGLTLAAAHDDLRLAEEELRAFLDEAPPADPRRAGAEASLRDVHAKRVEGEVRHWSQLAKTAQLAAGIKGARERDKAEGAWGRVVELRDDDAEALLALGQIYEDRNEHTPASVVLSRVAASTTADASRRQHAETLLAKIRKAGIVATGDGVGIAESGDKYFAGEAWTKAVDSYQAALAVSPYLSRTRMKLIVALLSRAKETGAAADAQAAATAANRLVALYPDDDAAAVALRSTARLAAGDKAGALVDARDAVRQDDKSAAAQLARGFALLANGEATDALAAFQTANHLDATPEALFGIVRAHDALGDPEAALGALETLEERFGFPRALRRECQEMKKRLSDGK